MMRQLNKRHIIQSIGSWAADGIVLFVVLIVEEAPVPQVVEASSGHWKHWAQDQIEQVPYFNPPPSFFVSGFRCGMHAEEEFQA
jgi:hypothetical protein